MSYWACLYWVSCLLLGLLSGTGPVSTNTVPLCSPTARSRHSPRLPWQCDCFHGNLIAMTFRCCHSEAHLYGDWYACFHGNYYYFSMSIFFIVYTIQAALIVSMATSNVMWQKAFWLHIVYMATTFGGYRGDEREDPAGHDCR
jgi:hypothetical protein